MTVEPDKLSLRQLYNRKLLAKGFTLMNGVPIPPAGMGGFAAQGIENDCLAEAQRELATGLELFTVIVPDWHQQNPWKDRLIYVPIEELAQACHLVGRPVRNLDDVTTNWDVEDVLHNWQNYGDKLDAYILTGPLMTGGVRFGPDGPDYLSPGFLLPKLHALKLKYGDKK